MSGTSELPMIKNNRNKDRLLRRKTIDTANNVSAGDDDKSGGGGVERQTCIPELNLTKPNGVSSSLSGQIGGASASTWSLDSLLLVAPRSKYVKLNVGGSLFCTTIDTLTKQDTMLRAMFSDRLPLVKDEEGWIMFDRCGKHFGIILNYLRDGIITADYLPDSRCEITELLVEARFYCISDVIKVCTKKLLDLDEIDAKNKVKREKESRMAHSNIPLVSSREEEMSLIEANSDKPVIKLQVNRHYNKYSYIDNSDDNILKNIELFDKLCLRFSNRALFLKDVVNVGSSEICCWSFFHPGGRSLVSYGCSSIVYGTGQKKTKIEFPEARIYEATLSCLLLNNCSVRLTGEEGGSSSSESSSTTNKVDTRLSWPY